ncbi:MAG: endo-1,4-beta-xylanase [Saprospiraceae bacterium]|nr:endo-1,4-beta-xylanase [Saprospiraceae bacterium]
MIKILPYPLFLLLLLISHCTFAQSLPVVVELESGQVGSAFETKLENAVTFVSVTGNGTGDLPTSAERVIKLTVTFQEAGEYDLYLRCRVGPNAANDDSFFYGNGFGEKSLSNAEEWIRANGLSGVGYSNLNELVDGGGGAGQNIWKWINLSEFTGDEAPVKFTVDAGNLTRTFVIGAREDGFDMDKIAFANASLFYSVKNLDNKEPGRTTSGPDFRPIAEGKGKFLGNVYSSSQIRWFENYWNQVTPENAGKWGAAEPQRDVMNWTDLDAAYKLAKDNGFPFKLHVLIWGSQQPSWMENLPANEQYAEIVEWYQAVADRYPDIDIIEVVNEPLHAAPFGAGKGNYGNALGGNGSTGWDWIIESFKLAREKFPKSHLMINDYSIVNNDASTTQYLQIINLLKARNLIDGVGVQAHAFSTRGSSTQMKNNLDRLAATGLPLYATELDIDGPTDQIQLSEYQRIFPIFWEHPAVKGITLWGWRTGLWRTNEKAYIMGEDGTTERPALVWLREYISSFPTSDQSISLKENTVLYPNPVTGRIVYHNAAESLVRAELISASGSNLGTMSMDQNSIYLPENITNGMYFIKLTGKKTSEVRPLMIMD